MLFPESYKLVLGDTVLEEKVVGMTVGFGHDREIEIGCGQGSSTSKHHLRESPIEHSF